MRGTGVSVTDDDGELLGDSRSPAARGSDTSGSSGEWMQPKVLVQFWLGWLRAGPLNIAGDSSAYCWSGGCAVVKMDDAALEAPLAHELEVCAHAVAQCTPAATRHDRVGLAVDVLVQRL